MSWRSSVALAGSAALPSSIADPPDSVEQLAFAFAADGLGRLYWLGGGEGANVSGFSARCTASNNRWATLPAMPLAVREACACQDGLGHILVFGGVKAGGSVTTVEVQQFDVAAGTWSTTAVSDLPTPVSGARAVLGVTHVGY